MGSSASATGSSPSPRGLDAAIIGAQKSGTTGLLRHLASHPDIATHRRRELPYFLKSEDPAQPWARILEQEFVDVHPSSLLLAKSAGIMVEPEALARLHQHNPGMRLIAVLRDPVERAYSGFWYARRKGVERAETFEEALEAQASQSWNPNTSKHRKAAYVANGRYAEQLDAVLEHFPRDQLAILTFEEFRRDRQAACDAMFRFLGVDEAWTVPDLGRRNAAAQPRSPLLVRAASGLSPLARVMPARARSWANRMAGRVLEWNERPMQVPPLADQTRERLAQYYEPLNQDLATRFGVDVSGWSRPSG